MGSPGNGHEKLLEISEPPSRVVSLVPSFTESLFDLGLGHHVVGITDYCTYPDHALTGLPRVGGPKNPRTDEIVSLEPDLVLANMEENTRQAIEELEAAGLKVWVTFPKTVRQSLDLLWIITGIYSSVDAAVKLETLEFTLEWVLSAAREKKTVRYFCPIWSESIGDAQSWWMTFNRDTYCNDVLGLMGGENIFSARERRYPLAADLGSLEPELAGDRDIRYPRVSRTEIIAGNPEIILLPSEPFPFAESHREQILSELGETDAVQSGRVYLVDGSLITWHGTRLARALQELPDLFAVTSPKD
ncbi:MAG: ABC transporter substrate-binding protein [bacterium]